VLCSFEEGFGLPMIEALVSGCVVVASNIPAFRELASEGCIFVNPASPPAIAAEILGAASITVPDDVRSRIGATFDWDAGYAKLRGLLDGLLAEAHGR
jgi:glycosyltransferase involved in cell wall biosynthesis